MIGDEECPCGQVHEFSAEIRAAYEAVTAGKGEDRRIAVEVRSMGAWLVPVIFLAAHGLKAAELPALAARYGFERILPSRLAE